MKKTQTIVDRERLSSGYIESKQDFSNVLSQVKLLPTTTWKSPWFYGPIGIAVLSVTISIVSINPSNAIASSNEQSKNFVKTNANVEVVDRKSETDVKEEVVEELKQPEKLATLIIPEAKKTIAETVDNTEVATKVQEDIAEVIIDDTPIETATIERTVPRNNRFPYIDGYFTGEIPLENLFSKNGILLNQTVQVTSFELNFFTGRSNAVNKIKGNKIPDSMHSMITNFNIGKTIFITNIKAVDRDGRTYTLPSMNFIPI